MIAWILGTLAIAALVFVLLSPLESLRWWADRGEREVRDTFELLPEESCADTDSHRFLVYLSGVGVLGGDELSGRELAWLESVAAEVPDVKIVADVFPYSVDNSGLLQQRYSATNRRANVR